MLLLAASAQSGYGPTLIAMIFGLVVGIAGHLVSSRSLVLAGIAIIGFASAYFTFVLSRVT